MLSREYDCPANIGTKKVFTLLLETKLDKNVWKKSPFVADFGCNR